ncbi:MAG: C4-type zinc ribbon domain-containing protein [Campylobacterales bacterium]|jgi:predicted  nucleic acid-binding Zn-ribbon protein
MNRNLEQLIKLSQIETQIAELEPVERRIKAPILRLEEQKRELEEQKGELEREIKELKLKIGKSDLTLKELKEKLEEIKEKLFKITEERELKALQVEEELAKSQIEQANEEIARLEKILEQKREELAEINRKIEQLEAEITLKNVEIEEKLKVLEEQRRHLFEKREKLVRELNPKIYTFYEKIKRWAGTTAVVPVERHACSGCHMVISDKLYTEIMKGEDISTCPHCGRVLYWLPEGEEN